jgi:hypothetical protein
MVLAIRPDMDIYPTVPTAGKLTQYLGLWVTFGDVEPD